MKVFHEFHARGKFERSLSATFIALILKISRAVDPIEFCLISLVSHIYKIIAKILTNRLRWCWERLFQSRKMLSYEVGKF
jgi:hypothetical protein